MIAIVLLGLLACASAGPKRRYHYQHHHNHCHGHSHYEDDSNSDDYSDPSNESQMFDRRRLWVELSKQIMRLDTKLTDLSKHFNRNEASTLIDDKEYKIFLQLQGFLEKEIFIKVKNGLLFVEAIRKVVGEPDIEYLNIMTLPDNVGEKSSWIYKNGLLKIIFPIKQVGNKIPKQTAAPDQNMELSGVEPYREKTSNNAQDNDQNENIFGTNGDLFESNKQGFRTHETSGHEKPIDATYTYNVDLNHYMEHVPTPR